MVEHSAERDSQSCQESRAFGRMSDSTRMMAGTGVGRDCQEGLKEGAKGAPGAKIGPLFSN
jgi:hypothetical protein